MRVLTVVGARPQFIKAGPVSRAIRAEGAGIAEYLVHTGQHYDDDMSRAFFDELRLPEPDVNLEIGSASHGVQTARMLQGLERVMVEQRPDLVLVYGDTNSTLAGALAAAKLAIPVAHVEAGLRSFRRDMPEEINRVVADRLSALCFCPTETAVRNLAAEGITQGVSRVGDVMIDAMQLYRDATDDAAVLRTYGVEPKQFYLLTVHRAENTDSPDTVCALLDALRELDMPVIFPVHPRTKPLLAEWAHRDDAGAVRLVSPASYLEMLALQANAAAVLTDSGGMQKEAYCLHTPCLTLRNETEWIETLDGGWNRLVGFDPGGVVFAIARVRDAPPDPACHRPAYGDGHAADRICASLRAHAG